MGRPKKKENEKAIRVHINLDYQAHENLKKRGMNISQTINQLLRIALFGKSDDNLIPAGSHFILLFNDKNSFFLISFPFAFWWAFYFILTEMFKYSIMRVESYIIY